MSDSVTNERALLFSRISRRYDLINTIISFGLDGYWRRKAAKLAAKEPPKTAADLCCGTGKMAFALAKTEPAIKHISCYDISGDMLSIASYKKAKHCPNAHIDFTQCDCAQIPCPDNTFDLVTCAFGLRNMQDPQKALAEMRRILRPSGTLCILEFTLPKTPALLKMYMVYFRFILPNIAALLGADKNAYKYFVNSVCRWDKEINMEKLLKNAAFPVLTVKKLTFGSAAIYLARKPDA